MTRLNAAIAARRRRYADDRGVSLVIALIFITVVAIVMGVVLSFAETNLRTTTAMRTQAARAAAADGAAKVAINALRTGTFCFGSSGSLSLPSFAASAGTSDSAVVTCAPDESRTVIATVNSTNKPFNALLTLAKDNPGIHVGIQGSGNKTYMTVKGGIFSNSNVEVDHGILVSDKVTARTGCTADAVNPTPYPAPQCSIGNAVNKLGDDPNYDTPPVAPAGTVDPPTCDNTNKVYTLLPGRYTDVAKLNALTMADGNNDKSKCKNSVYWFSPGIYYFDFTDAATPWTISHGIVLGGGDKPGSVAGVSVPGACPSPVPPNPVGSWKAADNIGKGVQFVFGGTSRIYLAGNAKAEVCGQYATNAPPVAIYGLKDDLGTGASLVRKQQGCITTGIICPVISTSNNNDEFELYVQGTTYFPRAYLDLDLKKELTTAFHGGLIANRVSIDGPGNTVPPDPIVDIPDGTPGGSHTVVWLQVYLCPGEATCAADASRLRLRAKVNVTEDETGARSVDVLNWSVQR
jgi:hypothetical protein